MNTMLKMIQTAIHSEDEIKLQFQKTKSLKNEMKFILMDAIFSWDVRYLVYEEEARRPPLPPWPPPCWGKRLSQEVTLGHYISRAETDRPSNDSRLWHVTVLPNASLAICLHVQPNTDKANRHALLLPQTKMSIEKYTGNANAHVLFHKADSTPMVITYTATLMQLV